jgi:hypothetical protein
MDDVIKMHEQHTKHDDARTQNNILNNKDWGLACKQKTRLHKGIEALRWKMRNREEDTDIMTMERQELKILKVSRYVPTPMVEEQEEDENCEAWIRKCKSDIKQVT